MKPLYIFDLDGTLANIDHRRHFVEDKKNKRWDEFYRACVDDLPNNAIITILNTFIIAEQNCSYCLVKYPPISDIIIFSGRSDIVKHETIKWLCDCTDFGFNNALFLKAEEINI